MWDGLTLSVCWVPDVQLAHTIWVEDAETGLDRIQRLNSGALPGVQHVSGIGSGPGCGYEKTGHHSGAS